MPRNGEKFAPLDRPASRDEVPDEHDNADHENDVDQPTRHMEGEEPERPQDE
jgi:hypothetical protein